MKRRNLLRTISCTLALAVAISTLPVQGISAAGDAGVQSGVTAMNDTQNNVSTEGACGSENAGNTGDFTNQAEVGAVGTSVSAGDSTGGDTVHVLHEVEELREEDTKHFRMSDGSFLAVAYGLPVHYQDEEGEWKDIDNTLTLTTKESGIATYEAATADTATSFASTLAEGDLFTVSYKDVSIALSLLDTAEARELTGEGNYAAVQPAEDPAIEKSTGAAFDADVTSDGFENTTKNTADAWFGTSDPTIDGPLTPPEEPEESGEEGPEITVPEIPIVGPVEPREPLHNLTYNRTAVADLQPESREENILTAELSAAAGAYSLYDLEELVPDTIRTTLLYEEVYPGVDFSYSAYSHNIKEQVIVNELQESYRYDFLLELEGLTAVLNTDGSISLHNAEGKEMYSIPAPFMVDATGARSEAVTYTLTETASGFVLTMEADKEWIHAPERVLPVQIDPTVWWEDDAFDNVIDCTFTEEGIADIAKNSQEWLFTGANILNEKLNRNRAYVHFNDLPELPQGCEMVDALFTLRHLHYYGNGCTGTVVGLHEVTTPKPSSYATYADWMSAITWNTQPSYDAENLIDYVTPNQSYLYPLTWDISELAKKWYEEGTENRTLALIDTREQEMTTNFHAYSGFNVYDESSCLIVAYRNTVGMEPYYTYTNVGAGNAGTGYICDHTGQFKVVREVASYASTVNPFSLNLVYNSDYFAHDTTEYQPPVEMGLSMKVGSGWNLDAVQTIANWWVGTERYLQWKDGDGTIHYFRRDTSDGLYYDEDGLGLTIRKIDDLNYEMWDKQDNLWIFENGFLKTVMDNNRTKTGDSPAQDGNKYDYLYSADNKLSYIIQTNRGGSAVTVASFGYDANGYLTSITDAAGQTTRLSYTGSDLTGISRQDYAMASYTYDGHRMTGLTDTNQKYAIELGYTNGRVTSYKEKGNGALGTSCEISYANVTKTRYRDYGQDRIKSSDDIYTYCLFDYAGRTVNLYSTGSATEGDVLTDSVLGAGNAVYTPQAEGTGANASTAFKKNNRITKSAEMGVAAMQLMEDFGFEKGLSNTSWTLEGLYSEGNGTSVTISGDNPRTGAYSFKGWIPVNNTATTGVGAKISSRSLTAGETYTFSAYVNTSQITQFKGKGVCLEVLKGSTSLAKSHYINYTTSTSVNEGWVRLSVTFTPAASGVHTLRIYNDRGEGILYADDFQLEKGEAPSNVNLLTNGDMGTSGSGWTLENGGSYTNGGLCLTGDPAVENRRFYQDVAINLPATETFVLSGWVKANAVPDARITYEEYLYLIPEKRCGLRAMIHYTDGTDEYHYVPFHADLNDWQFASLAVVPKEKSKTIEYIRVAGLYETNANKAYFDNLSLIRETARTMTYDSEGNLISVADTGLKEETDTYEDGNLIRSVTGGQGSYKYDYDTTFTRRLIKTTVEGVGLSQGYTHDSYGNVTGTTLSSTLGTTKIKTSATYSSDGNRQATVTDASGGTTTYTYGTSLSEMLGTPTKTTDANGNKVEKTYDTFGRVTAATVYDVNGSTSTQKAKVTYSYSNFRPYEIKRIENNAIVQKYQFSYDSFGNVNTLKVGSKTLATYAYESKNGPLLSMNYANGDGVSYTYDKYGRLQTETHDTGSLTYTYNGEGLLHSITENNTVAGNTSTYLYTYDTLGRLLYSERLNNGSFTHRIANTYNDKNQLTAQGIQMSGMGYSQGYTYAEGDGSLTGMTIDLDGTSTVDHTINLTYDHLRRLQTVGNDLFFTSYTYEAGADSTLTTNRIKALWYSSEVGGGLSFQYAYDSVGNITSYGEPSGTTTYEYDALGQLTKATKGSTVYSYTYDSGGNLLTAKSGSTTHTYTYGGSSWKDLLTAYDGHAITYDGAGNPLSYYNGSSWTFDWVDGRKLNSVTDANGTVTNYVYDVDGTRRNKTVGGVAHYYIWEDGRPLKEYVAGKTDIYNAADTMYFFYDQNGAPYALMYNNTTYYYILNVQGDVIRLVDSSGTTVASYVYDPYGNMVSATGSMAQKNPLRYRGYYYDQETGFYYLNARYYDPKVGRFLNADAVECLGVNGDTSSYNLFAYCGNNPISRKDDGGTAWETVLDVASLGASIVEVAINPTDPWAWAGVVGDAVDLIPFVTGVGEVTRAVKTYHKVDDVVEVSKSIQKSVSSSTGAYEILYASGMNYVGKGDFGRAIRSAAEHAKPNKLNNGLGDTVISIRWKASSSVQAAFMEEYGLQTINGINNSSTYNLIWSPGKKYYFNMKSD